MNEKKILFVVDIGRISERDQYLSLEPNYKSIFVVARDYNEAANKASLWLEYKIQNRSKRVLTHDGSLDTEEYIPPKILGIKMAQDEVLW